MIISSFLFCVICISSFHCEDELRDGMGVSDYQLYVHDKFLGAFSWNSQKELCELFTNLSYSERMRNLSDTSYPDSAYNIEQQLQHVTIQHPVHFLDDVSSVLRKTKDRNTFIVPEDSKDYEYRLLYDLSVSFTPLPNSGKSIRFYLATHPTSSFFGLYAGWEITKFNGEDIFTAVVKFAKEQVSTVRSALPSFNEAVKYFFHRPLKYFKAPSPDLATLTITNGEEEKELELDWILFNPNSDSSSYFYIPDSSQPTSFTSFNSDDHNIEGGYFTAEDSLPIGFIRIHSFSTSGTGTLSKTPEDIYISSIYSILNETINHFCSSLYIDLRSTTGENRILSQALFKILFPSVYPSAGKQDFKKGILSTKEADYLALQSSNSLRDAYGYESSSLFTSSNIKSFKVEDGSTVAVPYVTPFTILYKNYAETIFKTLPWKGYSPYLPSSLFIITDGISSTACSEFLSHVRGVNGAIIIGEGIPNVFDSYNPDSTSPATPPTVSDELYSYSSLSSASNYSIISSTSVPITSDHVKTDLLVDLKYLQNIYISLSYSEIYSFDIKDYDSLTSLQFSIVGPDLIYPAIHSHHEITLQDSYDDIAKIVKYNLPECFDWQTKKTTSCDASTSESVAGYKCSNGHWVNQCEDIGCVRGFYQTMPNNTMKCELNPEYTSLYEVSLPPFTSSNNNTINSSFTTTLLITEIILLILLIIYLAVMVLCGCTRKQHEIAYVKQ